MSVSESQRHQLFNWFEETMGPERAAVMIDLLPPVGWGDLATRADLDSLRVEIGGEFARLEGRIDRLDGRLGQMDGKIGQLEGKLGVLDGKLGLLEGKMEHGFGRLQKSVYLSMLTSNVTVVTLVLAVLKIA